VRQGVGGVHCLHKMTDLSEANLLPGSVALPVGDDSDPKLLPFERLFSGRGPLLLAPVNVTKGCPDLHVGLLID
jgi:hypothetical protein